MSEIGEIVQMSSKIKKVQKDLIIDFGPTLPQN